MTSRNQLRYPRHEAAALPNLKVTSVAVLFGGDDGLVVGLTIQHDMMGDAPRAFDEIQSVIHTRPHGALIGRDNERLRKSATQATAQGEGVYRLNVGENVRIAIPQTGISQRPSFSRTSKKQRFPAGENPTRQKFQPDATGAGMEGAKRVAPSEPRMPGCADQGWLRSAT
jgi:hypothetical protein